MNEIDVLNTFGLAEFLKLLDLPVIIGIVIISAALKYQVKKQNMPLIPIALGIVTGAIVESFTATFNLWMVWRRMLIYGGGASLGYQLWTKKIRPKILGDDTLSAKRLAEIIGTKDVKGG